MYNKGKLPALFSNTTRLQATRQRYYIVKGVWPLAVKSGGKPHFMFLLCTETKMASRKRSISTTNSCESSSKKPVRRLSKATFEKWKRDNEVAHQTMSWLSCELERDRSFVAMLHWSMCKTFEQHIQSGRNFSAMWITESSNKKGCHVMTAGKTKWFTCSFGLVSLC